MYRTHEWEYEHVGEKNYKQHYKSISRGARQNYNPYSSEELKDWMRNYLQPEGKLKPTQHKTSTYNRSLSQATHCMV